LSYFSGSLQLSRFLLSSAVLLPAINVVEPEQEQPEFFALVEPEPEPECIPDPDPT
jgi:hypothetical protein